MENFMHITQGKTQEYLRNKLRVDSRKFSSLIPQMGQVGGAGGLLILYSRVA